MLKKFTGIIISANTISKYVYCEAKNIRKMLTTRSNAQKEFIEASGVTELMTDGTMVNTTKGWKEVRLIQASKRQLGDYTNADTLSERHLPKPTVVYCLGFLESSKRFVSCRGRPGRGPSPASALSRLSRTPSRVNCSPLQRLETGAPGPGTSNCSCFKNTYCF